MTDDAPDAQRSEPIGPISDQDVEAVVEALQPDAEIDVRLDETEASEHIGTGTDR